MAPSHSPFEVEVKVVDAAQTLPEAPEEDPWLAKDAANFMQHVDSLRIPTNGSAAGLSAQSTVDRSDLTRVIRVTLQWRHLSYWVVAGGGGAGAARRCPPPCCRRRVSSGKGGGEGEGPVRKMILRDLSAAVPPGRLVAIMGPSGCGKTSLVNALAGRLPRGGVVEGEVLINGVPRGEGFRSITSYVMQDDVLFHNLTVRETFEFAAAMRLPASVPKASKQALVAEIMRELGLSAVQNTYIGNAFVRGVSGGERKRCNIGIELLSSPSLLFLDEPTSGLDAFQAQNVMQSLWSLARVQGRTVVATIHQPRSSIYRMFDLLLLLSEGQAVYFGAAAEAVSWFAGKGFPCPERFNPADFFLDVVSVDHRSPAAAEGTRRRVGELAALFRAEQAAGGGPQVPEVEVADSQAIQALNLRPAFPNSLPVEFGLLLSRAWKQQSRDKLPQMITLMQTVVIGFVLAALFSNIQMDTTGIQNELGILFFISVFSAMAAMFAALNTFPTERGIINRERAGKAYHVLPYYLARFICDMPLRVTMGLLFGCIVYWIVGLNPTAAAFFKFVAFVVLDALASQGLGVAVSAVVKTEKLAFAVAPGVTIILFLFGGFFVSKDSIPAVIRWITYLSHLYWCFMGLAINDFRGRTGWTCDDGSTAGCITNGDQVLARLGFESNELWEPYVGLACLILGYNFLGYVALRLSKQRFLPLTPAPKNAA